MGSAPQPISVDPTLARKFGLQPLKSDVGTSFDTQNRPDASPFKAHIVSLNAQQYSIDPSDTPLPEPSNRLTSSSMTVAREEIDAKLAASEARTEARFAEMNGKFDLVLAKMDSLTSSVAEARKDAREDAKHTRNTLWVVATIIVAIIGLSVAVWLGGLDLGTKVSDLVDQKVASIQPPAEVPPAPAQQ